MKTFLLSFIFLSSLLFSPDSVSAQGLVPCDGIECNACHFVELGNTVLTWLIGVLFVVFAVILAAAGWGLATSAGNQTALDNAKSKFTNAFIGLFIVLGAWLLVDTVMKGLIGNGGEISGYGPWSEVKCVTPQTTAYGESGGDEVGTVGVTASGPTPAGNASLAAGALADSSARPLVDSAGIEYKDSVSFQGVRPHVIEELKRLDVACSCNLTITAVTDGNHADGTFSHANGFKADLRTRDNPELVEYVAGLEPAGSWQNGTQLYYDAESCGTYAVEGDHIDVVYKTGC
jgi:hypothetical protein